jgi:hypothetical protein
MNQEKIQNQVTKNYNSKSLYDSELMFNINSNNPVITIDEYIEMNNLHAEFEEWCEKLGYKLPYNK